MKTNFIILLCLLGWMSLISQSVHLNINLILNPINGERLMDSGVEVSDELLSVIMNQLNDWSDEYMDGWTFEYEITDIGGIEHDLSFTHFFNALNNHTRRNLEIDAEADPVAYNWSSNAINIYLIKGDGSLRGAPGVCSWPFNDDNYADDAIMINKDGVLDYTLWIHELGHYFGLYHTHGACDACILSESSCHTVPGDDEISDTLPDAACYNSKDDIALYTYSMDYSQLTLSEKMKVDDVYHNVMSYHDLTGVILTQEQKRRWQLIPYVYRSRVATVSGLKWYVDKEVSSSGIGTQIDPFKTFREAVEMSGQNPHIVFLTDGEHNEISSNQELLIEKKISIKLQNGESSVIIK